MTGKWENELSNISTFRIWKELVPFNTFLEELPRRTSRTSLREKSLLQLWLSKASHEVHYGILEKSNRNSYGSITFWQPHKWENKWKKKVTKRIKNVLRYLADSWQLVPAQGRFLSDFISTDRRSTTSEHWVHLMQFAHHLVEASQKSSHLHSTWNSNVTKPQKPKPHLPQHVFQTLVQHLPLRKHLIVLRLQTWFLWCHLLRCLCRTRREKMQTWNS